MDGESGRSGLSFGIGGGELNLVGAGLGEGLLEVGGLAEFFAIETPLVSQFVAIGVGGTGGIEFDFQRLATCGLGGGDPGNGSTIATAIDNANNTAIGVVPPLVSVFNHVEGSVMSEFQVDGAAKIPIRKEGFHVRTLCIKIHSSDPVPHPFVDEKLTVEFFGKLDRSFAGLIEPVNRTCHDRATSAADGRELFGWQIVKPDEGRFGRREILDSSVFGRRVGGLVGVLAGDFLVIIKVKQWQGFVLSDEGRPAEVSGSFGGNDLFVSDRIDSKLRHDIWTNVADVESVVEIIYTDAERIANAHGVDLGATVFSVGEKVVCGNGIGTVSFRFDSKNFAAEISGVGSRTKGIPTDATFPKVDRQTGVPVTVVAIANIELIFAIHPHGPAHVIDVFGIVRKIEQLDL